MTVPAPLPAASKPTSSMAIVSLVAGILGWTFVPTLGALAAILTGYLAKNDIRQSHGALGGEGMAQAGIILGFAHFAILFCVCILILALWGLGLGAYLLSAIGHR